MNLRETLASFDGERVELSINNKITFYGTVGCSKYSSNRPYISTDFIKIEFSASCITQLTCTKSDVIVSIELSPEPKLDQDTEAPTSIALPPLE